MFGDLPRVRKDAVRDIVVLEDAKGKWKAYDHRQPTSLRSGHTPLFCDDQKTGATRRTPSQGLDEEAGGEE